MLSMKYRTRNYTRKCQHVSPTQVMQNKTVPTQIIIITFGRHICLQFKSLILPYYIQTHAAASPGKIN